MCDTTIGQNAIETWKKKECSSFGYFSKAANFTVLLEQLMQSDSSLIVNPSFLPTVKGLYKKSLYNETYLVAKINSFLR